MPSPIVSATFQAAGLSTVSNICAQLIDAYQKSTPFAFDLAQLLRFVALAFLTAPPNYHWQQFLERSFPAYLNADGTAGTGRAADAGRAKDDVEMKAGVANDIVGVGSGDASEARGDAAGRGKFSLRNTLTKWFIDCITMGAIMNTVAFLVLMGVMKGQGWTQISSNIRTVCVSHGKCVVSLLTGSLGDDPDYCGRVQDLANCVHHQLLLHPCPPPHCVPELHWPALGHLHEPCRG